MSKRVLQSLLIFIISIFFYLQASATHIIGGIITYECLGNGKYEFTLRIYRDCLGGVLPFDAYPVVSIYQGNTAPYKFIKTYNKILGFATDPTKEPPQKQDFGMVGTPTFVQAPNYTCFELPNLCVQEAIYKWTDTFADWPSLQSYHVVYQRCCRNATIKNIEKPSESGVTYTVEITPEAQKKCNNSPTFTKLPPTVICAGQPLVYDHSAIDKDGDKLEYSLCAPLLGGGYNSDSTKINSCVGWRPDPACSPPFAKVVYSTGYSEQNPMGGNPTISIDKNTGLMTGTPNVIGQFVIGVCVEEFRNGVSMGKVFRDFQFNVTNCSPNLEAAIDAPKAFGKKLYTVNSCESKTINLKNLSTDTAKIKNYLWEFDVKGTKVQKTSKNLSITFPDYGTYKGILYLNKGETCNDSAQIIVNIYPNGKTFFQKINLCEGETFKFNKHIYSKTGVYQDTLKTTFGCDSLVSTTLNINLKKTFFQKINLCGSQNIKVGSKIYSQTGIYKDVLKTISTGCDSTVTTDLTINQSLKKTLNATLCNGEKVTFAGKVYQNQGVFYDTLKTIGGCDSLLTINIKVAKKAIFSEIKTFCENENIKIGTTNISKSGIYVFNLKNKDGCDSTYTLTATVLDTSIFYQEYLLCDGDSIQLGNKYYSKSGSYQTLLKTKSGCDSTLVIDIKQVKETYCQDLYCRMFIPNAFSPNEDGINDIFEPYSPVATFTQLQIFDRWGGLRYENNSNQPRWELDLEKDAFQIGIYVFVLRGVCSNGKTFVKSGDVLLER